MRSVEMLVLVLLSGCSFAAAAQPGSDLAGAQALIGRIYTAYVHDDVPDLDGLYTPELRRSIRRQSDGDLGLGYDPLCSCQDTGDFTYRIASLVERKGGAAAQVDFDNFGEHHSVTLLLVRRGGRWFVGDIIEDGASLLKEE
ncbi:MAG TPA: DUF3828 domain-containing protein [Sphingopyxis sp.]|nr:DUF3828 domain-containing protein [Sphingopyxis sp.]